MESYGRKFLTSGVVPLALALLIVGVPDGPARAQDGEYVGASGCADCHDEIAQQFGVTAHGMADISGWDAAEGCEACHGPGGAHVEAGGDPELIVGAAAMDADAATGMCLDCHGGNATAHWQSSTHDAFDASCFDCHRVHQKRATEPALVNKNTSELCLGCHKSLRKHLYQRSRHPLKEGLMSCVSCHDPHGSAAVAAISAVTPNDKCYECHAEKRGPFLFPHQPVAENCSTCHNPHGSNQASLLEPAPPRLCQSCHLFGHHQTVPGTSGQVWNVNRSCVNCHARIHGSNHPSGVIFMR